MAEYISNRMKDMIQNNQDMETISRNTMEISWDMMTISQDTMATNWDTVKNSQDTMKNGQDTTKNNQDMMKNNQDMTRNNQDTIKVIRDVTEEICTWSLLETDQSLGTMSYGRYNWLYNRKIIKGKLTPRHEGNG